MKKLAGIFLLIITMNTGYAQTLTQKISAIRIAVQKINTGSGYSLKKLSNEEFLDEMPDGGGELIAYYKNRQLIKLVVKIGLSSCISTTEYYLKDGQLIFVYVQEKEWAYNEQLNKFDPQKLALKMECRYYYENAKAIDTILKGQTRCSGKPEVDWAKDHVANFNLYQKKLRANQ